MAETYTLEERSETFPFLVWRPGPPTFSRWKASRTDSGPFRFYQEILEKREANEMSLRTWCGKRRPAYAETFLMAYVWIPFLWALTRAIYGPSQFKEWESIWPRLLWVGIAAALFALGHFVTRFFLTEYGWLRADEEKRIRAMSEPREGGH